MKKLALDSSFVIDFLKDREDAKSFYQYFREVSISLPTIAKFEVKIGDSEIGKFDRLGTVGFNDMEVSEALEIKEFLEEKGEMINRLDIMIAAQAVNSNTVLVTREEDFDKLEEYEGFKHLNYERYVKENEPDTAET